MPQWIQGFFKGPFVVLGEAVWKAMMSLAMGIMSTTPQDYAPTAWEYVSGELYSWTLGIGISMMNLFLIIGFLKNVGDLKKNLNLEMLIEFMIRIVITNIVFVNLKDAITGMFSLSGGLVAELPVSDISVASWGLDGTVTSDNILAFWILGFFFFITAVVCGGMIVFTVYTRYIKLYILLCTAPPAAATLVGGQGIERSGYAWLRSLIGHTFEVVIIAMVMVIVGKIMSGGTFIIPDDSLALDGSSGLAMLFNSILFMVLMAISVHGVSGFMNRTFSLN